MFDDLTAMITDFVDSVVTNLDGLKDMVITSIEKIKEMF